MDNQSMPNEGMQKLYDSKFRFSMLGATLAIGGVFGICSSMLFLLGVVTVAGLTVAPLVPIIVASLSLCAEIGGVVILWMQRRSTLGEFAEFANQRIQTLPPVNHGDSAALNELRTANKKAVSDNKILNFQISHYELCVKTKSAIAGVEEFCRDYDNGSPKKSEDLKILTVSVALALDNLSSAVDGNDNQLTGGEKDAILTPIRQAAARLICHNGGDIDPNAKPEWGVCGEKVYRLGSNWQCQLCCANILNGKDGAMLKFMNSLEAIMKFFDSSESADLSIPLPLFMNLFSCFPAEVDDIKYKAAKTINIQEPGEKLAKLLSEIKSKNQKEISQKFTAYQSNFLLFVGAFPDFQVVKNGALQRAITKVSADVETLVDCNFPVLTQNSERDWSILVKSNEFIAKKDKLSIAVEDVKKSEAAIWELLTQAEPPAPEQPPEQDDT
ncbi:MAG: hypothetical protein LBS68_00775 [Puniceicoccales bacterium]|jgi:hypothetical protein|nr:hypothetical protein [Puniceicoccales bacterium]